MDNNLQNIFNYNQLFEGIIISVDENNECLVNIPMLFLNEDTDDYKVEESINNSNILDNDITKNTITSVNGLYCKPFYSNGISRKMNPGEHVTIIFKDGDPRKPYYINGYFVSKLEEYLNDSIYHNGDISIYTESDPPKIIFKVKDNIVEINENTMLGSGGIDGGDGTGGGSGGGSGNGWGGIGTDDIINVVTKDMYIKDIIEDGILDPAEKKFIKKELDKILKEHDLILQLANRYLDDEEVEESINDYTEKKDSLNDYINPMLIDMNTETEIDGVFFYNTFLEYYDARNIVLEEITNAMTDTLKGAEEYISLAISDNVFQPIDKDQLNDIFNEIKEEKPILIELALLFNVVSRNYDKAYEKEFDYLYNEYNGILNNLNISTRIDDPLSVKNDFMDVFITKVELMKAILRVSKQDSDSKLEAVKIGSANICLNSNFKKDLDKWHTNETDKVSVNENSVYEKEIAFKGKKIFNDLSIDIFKGKTGDDMVISLYAKSKKEITLKIYLCDEKGKKFYSGYQEIKINNSEYNRYEKTFKLISDVSALQIANPPKLFIEVSGGELFASQFKLEFGTVATDWTPSREDIAQEIEDGKTEINNKIEEMNSTFTQTFEKFQMTVEQLQAERTDIWDSINGTHTSVTEISQKMAEFLLTVDNIFLGLEHTYGRLETIENTQENYNKTITTIREQVSQIDIQIDSINMLVSDMQETIINIVTESNDGLLEEFEKKLVQLEAKFNVTLSGITGSVSRLEESIKEINKTNTDLDEKINLLEKKVIKENADFVLSLQEIILRLSKEEEHSISFNEQLADKVNNLEFKEVKDQVSGISQTLDDIKMEVGKNSETLTNVQIDLDGKASQSSVNEIDKKISTVNQTVDGIRQTVSSNQENITTIQSSLNDYNEPTKVTPLEKRQLKMLFDEINQQKTVLVNQGTSFGLTAETEQYSFACDDLEDFLFNTVDGILLNMETITIFNRVTLDNLLNDVYEKREILLRKIAQVTKDQADENLSQLLDMSADDKLTPLEKKEVLRTLNEITKEKESLVLQAQIFNLPTTLLENTYQALYDYLLGPGGPLTTMTITSTIDRNRFNKYFTDYYDVRSQISRNITNANKQNAENMIGAIQLGATNICKNSNFASETKHWTFSSSTSKKEITEDPRFGHFLTTDDINIKEGLTTEILTLQDNEQMMFSGWFKGTAGQSVAVNLIEAETNRLLSETEIIALTSEWTHIEVSFENTVQISQSGIGLLQFTASSEYSMTNLQLEFGNISTAWKPSRDDITDEISNSTTKLTSMVEQAVSDFNQTVNGIEGSISSIRGTITTIEVELGGKVNTSSFTALENKVGEYKQTIDQNSAELERVNEIVISHSSSLIDMETANKVTISEKLQLQRSFGAIVEEHERLNQQADYYKIVNEKDIYNVTYGRLYDYIMVSPGMLSDMTKVTEIDRIAYNGLINDYYRDRDNLVARISLIINDLANEAKNDASTVNGKVDDMSADDKLTQDEKKSIKIDVDKIKKEYTKYTQLAALYSSETRNELNSYKTAYEELIKYIDPLLNAAGTSDIVRTEMTNNFSTYYLALTDLINKVDQASKEREDALDGKIDNIQIGGKNLLKNTNFKNEEILDWELYGDNINRFSLNHNQEKGLLEIIDNDITFNAGNIGIISGLITDILEPDIDYCLSFKAFGVDTLDHLDYVGILNTDNNQFTRIDTINIPTSESETVVHDVFQVDTRVINGKVIIGFIDLPLIVGQTPKKLSIKEIKLEKGNKPTDWSESLDDLKTEIKTLDRNYSSMNQTILGIQQTVGEQQQTIDDQGNRLNQAESNIQQTSNDIASLITKVDGIEVGLDNLLPSSGRDLLKLEDWEWDNTLSIVDIRNYNAFGYNSIYFSMLATKSNAWLRNKNFISVISNYYYAISVKIGGTVNTNRCKLRIVEYNDVQAEIKRNDVDFILETLPDDNVLKYKFITNVQTKYIRIYFIIENSKDTFVCNLWINDIMVQQGSLFSPWIPSSSDTASNLNQILAMMEDVRKDADSALDKLDEMMSDGKLTSDEKLRLAKELGEIKAEQARYIALIDLYREEPGAVEVKNLYNAKLKDLDDYLKPILQDMTVTTDINRVLLNAKFTDYYDARQGLVNKAAEFAKNAADDAMNQANDNKQEIENTNLMVSGIQQTVTGITSRVESVETNMSEFNINISELAARRFNNFSITGKLDGWSNSSEVPAVNKLYLDTTDKGITGILRNTGSTSHVSKHYEIDSNTTYRFNLSYKKLNNEGNLYFGFYAYDKDKQIISVGILDPSGSVDWRDNKNPYFTVVGETDGNWVNCEAYVLKNSYEEGTSFPFNKNCNNAFPFVLPSNACYISLRFLSYATSSGGTTPTERECQFYSPSITVYDNTIDAIKSDMDKVNDKIDDFSSDGLITVLEKNSISAIFEEIKAEKPGVSGQADLYSINKADYLNAFNTLSLYLTNDQDTGLLDNMLDTTSVDREELRTKFSNYYNARQLILDTIASRHKDAAHNAQQAAEAAAQDAEQNKKDLETFSKDDILTPLEKREVLVRWNSIDKEKISIINQAKIYNLSFSAYESAFNTLNSYLNNSTTGVISNMSLNTTISRTTFNNNFNNYFDARQALMFAIADAAKDATDQVLIDANEFTQGQIHIVTESFSKSTSEIIQNVDQIRQSVSNVQGNITTIEGNLSTIDNKLNNISIGASNLLHNSAFLFGTDIWIKNGAIQTYEVIDVNDILSFNKALHISFTNMNSLITQNVSVNKDIPHVLKGFLKIIDGTCGIQLKLTKQDGTNVYRNVYLDKEAAPIWKSFVIKIETGFTGIEVQIGKGSSNTPNENTIRKELLCTGLKLEEGNTPTSWSPSLYDQNLNVSSSVGNALDEAKKYAEEQAKEAMDAANNAAQQAQDAQASINGLTADNLLTAIEKKTVKNLFNDIHEGYSGLLGQANLYEISTNELTNAYNTLNSYLNNTTNGVLKDMNVNTNIVRSEFNDKFNDYYKARQDILDTIAIKAKENAGNILNDAKDYVDGQFTIFKESYTTTIAGIDNRLDAVDIFVESQTQTNTTIMADLGLLETNVNDRIDNIQIGANNLALNSGNFQTTKHWSNGVSASPSSVVQVAIDNGLYVLTRYMGAIEHDYIKLNHAQEYVAWIEVKLAESPVKIDVNNKYNIMHLEIGNRLNDLSGVSKIQRIHDFPDGMPVGEYVKLGYVFTTKDKVSHPNDIYLKFTTECDVTPHNYRTLLRYFQVEEGNISTAWRPNPMDEIERMQDLDIGGDNIIDQSGNFYKIDQWEDRFTNGLVPSANITISEETINGQPKKILNFEHNNINIGNSTKWSINQKSLSSNKFKFDTNKVYSLTGWFRSSVETGIIIEISSPDGSNLVRHFTSTHLEANTWRRFRSNGFKPAVAGENLYIRFFTNPIGNFNNKVISFCDWKLEEGTIPTAWTPSRKDVEDYTNEAKQEAIKVAEDAAKQAEEVQNNLDGLSSDNVLTAIEKKSAHSIAQDIVKEYPSVKRQAQKYPEILLVDYDLAYNLLYNYLYGTNGVLKNLNVNTNIDRSVFNARFSNYFENRQLVLDEIVTKTKENAENAANNALSDANDYTDGRVGDAVKAAEAAQAAADAAQSTADNAKLELNNMSSDNMLTAIEKKSVNTLARDIIKEKDTNVSNAARYSVDSSDYVNKYNTLYNYLYAQNTGVLISINTNTTINRTIFNNNFINYYNARQVLLDAIAVASKKAVDDALKEANDYTDGKITVVETKITQVQSGINTRLDSIDIFVKTQEHTNTTISQSIENTQSDLTGLSNRIDGISVGAANLVKNSGFENGNLHWTNTGSGINIIGDYYEGTRGLSIVGTKGTNNLSQQDIQLVRNKEYTMSCFYKKENISKGTTNCVLGLYVDFYKDNTWVRSSGTISFTEDNLATGDWKRGSLTFTSPSDIDWNKAKIILIGRDFSGTLYVDSIQLEEGNKITTWKPNYQDTLDKIDNIEVGGANLLKNTDRLITMNWITPNGITMTETDDPAYGKVLSINNASATYIDLPLSSNMKEKLNPGDRIVFSCMVNLRNSSNTTFRAALVEGSNIKYIESNKKMSTSNWVWISVLFEVGLTIPTAIRIDLTNIKAINMDRIKLERGSLPTAWSPNPEDTEDFIKDEIDKIDTPYTGRNLIHRRNIIFTTPYDRIDFIEGIIMGLNKNVVFVGISIDGNKIQYKEDIEYTLSFKIQKVEGTLKRVGGHRDDIYRDVKISIDNNVLNYEWNSNGQNNSSLLDDGNYHSVEYVFKVTGLASAGTNRYLWIQPNRGDNALIKVNIKDLKLEEGNKATSFFPAPEDLKDYIEDAQTSADQAQQELDDMSLDNKLTAIEKKSAHILAQDIIKDYNSLVEQCKKANINYNALTTAFNTLNNYLYGTNGLLINLSTSSDINRVTYQNNFNNYYENRKAILILLNNNIIDDINNIEVGGRNYFKRTTRMGLIETTTGRITKLNDVNGFRINAESVNGTAFRLYNTINSNGNWTVSFLVSTNLGGSLQITIDICDLGSKVFNISSNASLEKFTKIVHTVNVTNYTAELYHFVDIKVSGWGDYIFKDVKVERGNKATDWSPAPEDVQLDIDNTLNELDAFKDLDKWTVINNENDIYFPYDENAQSTSGLNPEGKATISSGGKFGKCLATYDENMNLFENDYSNTITPSIVSEFRTVTDLGYSKSYNYNINKPEKLNGNTSLLYYGKRFAANTNIHLRSEKVYTFSGWIYVSPESTITWNPYLGVEGTYTSLVSGKGIYDINHKGTWQFAYTTFKVNNVADSEKYINTLCYVKPNQFNINDYVYNVTFKDVQLTEGSVVIPYSTSTSIIPKSEAVYPDRNISYNSSYTMMAYKKLLNDNSFEHHALTKENDTFKYYINSSITDKYLNKWMVYKCKSVAGGATTGTAYDFVFPLAKDILKGYKYPIEYTVKETPGVSYVYNSNQCSYYSRCYAFCNSDTNLAFNINFDNVGCIYLNNEKIIELTGPKLNDVEISLNRGWNLIELCFSDYDTGGNMITNINDKIAENTNILYMTAELPVNMIKNSIGFLARFNVKVDDACILNSILKPEDIKNYVDSSKRLTDPAPILSIPNPYDVNFTII